MLVSGHSFCRTVHSRCKPHHSLPHNTYAIGHSPYDFDFHRMPRIILSQTSSGQECCGNDHRYAGATIGRHPPKNYADCLSQRTMFLLYVHANGVSAISRNGVSKLCRPRRPNRTSPWHSCSLTLSDARPSPSIERGATKSSLATSHIPLEFRRSVCAIPQQN